MLMEGRERVGDADTTAKRGFRGNPPEVFETGQTSFGNPQAPLETTGTFMSVQTVSTDTVFGSNVM